MKYCLQDLHNYAENFNGRLLSTEYIGNKSKYDWVCFLHGGFTREWKYMHQNHTFCPRCAMAGTGKKQKYTIKDLQKFAEKHSGKCITTEYINFNTKYIWLCNKHGIFNKTWKAMKRSEVFCYKCLTEEQRTYDIGFIKKWVKNSYNGECLSNRYDNLQSKLTFKCDENHIWEANWYNIYVNNTWCPYCVYKSEQRFRDAIEKVFGEKFPPKKVTWMRNPKTEYPLELDGYNEELKIAFEYQGRQHFEVIDCFGGEKKLQIQQERDAIKKQKCLENNIILLCPTYKLNPQNYSKWILKQLEENNYV